MIKTSFPNLEIHFYWTSYLQSIQKSLGHDYYYYKTGEVSFDKLVTVLTKLNDYYRLSDTPGERFNRFKDGFSIVVIHMLYTDEGIKFALMCRANQTKTGLFFEREKYADARIKKNRICLNNCYELVRINKEVYDPKTSTKTMENGVWTGDLTEQEKSRIYAQFNSALLKRDYKEIKQICYGLHHLIGFAGVRQSYLDLKVKLEKRFTKFMQGQKWSQYKVLSDLYRLPAKIGYIKKQKLQVFNVERALYLHESRAKAREDRVKLRDYLREKHKSWYE